MTVSPDPVVTAEWIAERDRLVRRHNLAFRGNHTDLVPGLCVCHKFKVAAPPAHTGNACIDCGGLMVRTGSCETCSQCGSTGGCG